MNAAMTCSTKPGYTIQLPFIVPAPFDRFGVHLLGYEVMICERYPVTFAYFAG